ncbi:MAG: GntR family transcriptional regulator [Planctomycetes bacterium]|nr:GntR family transcriptional regulator [Planctomycetota bacterium]
MVETQEEVAYKSLKLLILNGELPIGEFLSQRKLAERVGTAVVSLRGALRRLENEDLIESVPKWGVRVPQETEASIMDRYYFREILEAAAAEELAQRISEEDAEELMQLARNCDEVDSQAENATQIFAEHHMAFHLFVGRCTKSPLLLESLQRVLAKDNMLHNARSGWQLNKDSQTHHQDLARVIIAGDPVAAEKAMRNHIHGGLHAELAFFNTTAASTGE